MRSSLAALAVAALLVTACGDDSDDSDENANDSDENANDSSSEETAAPSTTAAERSGDEEEPGPDSDGDVDVASFCDEYQSAQATAENPASTDQFADLVPPEEIAALWEDYLDSDWDAGITVDDFIATNCFD